MGVFDPIRVEEIMNHGERESWRFSERVGERSGKCDRTESDRNVYGLLGTTGLTNRQTGRTERKLLFHIPNALRKALYAP
jgi:hypothetical protein